MRSWWLGPVLLALSATAHADPHPDTSPDSYLPPPPLPPASPITDHFALIIDLFWGKVSTFGRFDSATGVQGTPFTGERDLGLSDKEHDVRIEVMFRLEDRSRVRVDFLDSRRQADKNIDRTLQYGDQLFLIDDPVHSEFDWRQIDITYTYSFLRTERFELGAGLGIDLLQAEAIAQIPKTQQYANFNGAGPFATLALDGTWLIAKHWSFNARGQYLKVSVGSVSGMMGDYHADFQYRWKRNVAFGLGYEYQEAELDVRNNNPSGVLRLSFSGPQLFGRVSF
jgi:hypothetical protein